MGVIARCGSVFGQLFCAERVGVRSVQFTGFTSAFDGFSHLLAEERSFVDTEEEGAEDSEDGVEAERHTFEEEGDAVGLGCQKDDTGDKDKRLYIARPRIESELRGDGRTGGIDDVGQLFVADVFFVRQRFDGGSDEDSADGSALKEDDAE